MANTASISASTGPELSRVQDDAPNLLSANSTSLDPAQIKSKPRILQQHQQPQRMKEGDRQPRPDDIVVGQPDASSRNALDPVSPPRIPSGPASASPHRSGSPFGNTASPNRFMRSSSPRHLSPATSQIFERDVQESVVAPELSPAIPSHIQTEDHIPPVLEASSLALTDNQLDPDEVEIITHNAHQPASVNVTGAGLTDSHASMSGMSSLNELAAVSSQEHDETNSTYGAVDPNDARRLSFISFADVVNAEHAEGLREGIHPLSSAASTSGNRSPSPIRSPFQSGAIGGSPPTAGSASLRGAEASPVRGTAASISSAQNTHGELTIETMRQALQKPSTNDIPGTISPPMSAVSADESSLSRLAH